MRWIVLLVCLGGPASAAEHEIATYGPRLEHCYRVADSPDSKAGCLGTLSEACMTEELGGETTLGIAFCLNAEMQVWDRLLNAEYKATMDWARAMDDDERELFPEFAKRVDSLRTAQRAWIAFRDAECALAYAQWGSGSMRTIAGNECLMELTARRTIELLQLRDGLE